MNDSVLPRTRAARLRMVYLRVGALLTAIGALLAIPAGATADGPKLAHAPADSATIRMPRSRLITRSRLSTRSRLIARSRTRSHPSSAPRCPDAHVHLGGVSRRETEHATLCLLNRQRSAQGLPDLLGNAPLDRSAQLWTETMVHDRAFSHGSDFGARISAAGFQWSHIGENIAAGYRTPAGVVDAWMRSLGHCENILSPEFREVGAGFAAATTGGAGMRVGTWTLDLGLRIGQRAPSSDWTPAEHCPD